MTDYIDIVFDRRRGDAPARFIEAEQDGRSISLDWEDRQDGTSVLRVPVTANAAEVIRLRGDLATLRSAVQRILHRALYGTKIAIPVDNPDQCVMADGRRLHHTHFMASGIPRCPYPVIPGTDVCQWHVDHSRRMP